MLFDTDVLIWALRENQRAARRIDSAAERALSAVSLMELLQGARSKREMRQIQDSLAQLRFRVLPLSESIGSLAISLMERYSLAHGLQVADAMIAATAMRAGESLVTGNAKHFHALTGLKLETFLPGV